MTGTKVLAFQSFLIEKPANSRQYFSWQKGRNKAHHPFFYCQVGWKRNAWSFRSCDGNEANESWAGLIDISLCNITFSLLRVTVDRCFSFYTTATFRLSYSIQKKKKNCFQLFRADVDVNYHAFPVVTLFRLLTDSPRPVSMAFVQAILIGRVQDHHDDHLILFDLETRINWGNDRAEFVDLLYLFWFEKNSQLITSARQNRSGHAGKV